MYVLASPPNHTVSNFADVNWPVGSRVGPHSHEKGGGGPTSHEVQGSDLFMHHHHHHYWMRDGSHKKTAQEKRAKEREPIDDMTNHWGKAKKEKKIGSLPAIT